MGQISVTASSSARTAQARWFQSITCYVSSSAKVVTWHLDAEVCGKTHLHVKQPVLTKGAFPPAFTDNICVKTHIQGHADPISRSLAHGSAF